MYAHIYIHTSYIHEQVDLLIIVQCPSKEERERKREMGRVESVFKVSS